MTRTRGQKVDAETWRIIKGEYQKGIPVMRLSQLYGITHISIYKKIRTDKWVRGNLIQRLWRLVFK